MRNFNPEKTYTVNEIGRHTRGFAGKSPKNKEKGTTFIFPVATIIETARAFHR